MKYEDVEIHSERWLNLEDLLNEEWRDIQGYEGLYQVSNYGRVKSLEKNKTYITGRKDLMKEKILKVTYNTYKYLNITLVKNKNKKQQVIHRLVAQAFIPNPNNLPQVNHKNGIKEDNRVENLEWVTGSENMKHAYRTGLSKVNKTMLGRFGKENPSSKPVYAIDKKSNKIIMKFDSQKEAVKYLRIKSNAHISQCCNGKRKMAHGYIWRFADEYKT